MTPATSIRDRASARGHGALLDLLRRDGPATRGELTRRTNATRASVGAKLDLLMELDLVRGGGLRSSSGGRRPEHLAFAADRGVVVAAPLGATHGHVALCDLAGTILERTALDVPVAVGPDRLLEAVRGRIDELLARRQVDRARITGIGIGIPGPVEFAAGRSISPPIMPGWDGVLLHRYFRDLGVPVIVDNDANVMAIGEHVAARREVDDLILVKVGTGIGSGVISGGTILRGAQGAAGDFGHIRIAAGPRCRCGHDGCLEAIAGGAAVARGLSLEGGSSTDARGVVAAVRAGDPAAVAAVRQAGRQIGGVVASAVNFFNPALVIVSGDLAGTGDELLAGLREVVYQRSTALATRSLQILPSRLGATAGILGAASMILDTVFAPERIDAWVAGIFAARRAERATGIPSGALPRLTYPAGRDAHAFADAATAGAQGA